MNKIKMWIIASLASFFATSVGPIVKRVLVALGIGVVTYSGLDVSFGAARDLVISNYGAMAGDVGSLVSLAGAGQAIGIVLGALAARIGLISMSYLGRIL